MAAARVFDAMDYESDEQLLRENLNRNPPLHIRRTLDQYYFLTLDDTTARDRDQGEFILFESFGATLISGDIVVYRGTKKFDKGVNSWTTRVVMVDQLWLWILDDSKSVFERSRRRSDTGSRHYHQRVPSTLGKKQA